MPKQIKIIKFLSFAFFPALSYYLVVYNSFAYRNWNEEIGILLLSLPFFFLSYQKNKKLPFYKKSWFERFIMLLSMIVFGMFMFSQKNRYLKQEIAEYGIMVQARIIGFEQRLVYGRHIREHNYLIFDYSFEDKQWRQAIRYYEEIPPYTKHQELCIIISKRQPEMFLLCAKNSFDCLQNK